MFVYVEFISRLPSVSLRAFHFAAGGQDAWSGEHSEDYLMLNLGRTFRLGPEPEYMAVWYTPERGVDRIGDWEAIFRSGAADHLEETFKLGARIDKAGCYDPLLEPVRGRGALYYAEYLDFAPLTGHDDVRSFFSERAARHADCTLHLLADRIGKLGPEPRCVAVWGLPSWAEVDGVARELDPVDSPVRLVSAGMYRDLGNETL